MSRTKLFSFLRHAITMVGRTIKSYAMLSVTIVMSFSVLLGYMGYTDSSLYNQYKDLLSQRRGDMIIVDYPMDEAKFNLLLDALDSLDNTDYYVAFYGSFGRMNGLFRPEGTDESETVQISNMDAMFVPDYVWLDGLEPYMGESSSEIVWLDGLEHEDLVLEADEILICEKLYYAFEMNKEEAPVFNLQSDRGPGLSLQVVGYLKSVGAIDYYQESWLRTPTIVLSSKLIEAAALYNPEVWDSESITTKDHGMINRRYVVIHSDHPEEVMAIAETMQYRNVYAVYERQNEALATIRAEKSNKAVIACALLLLLGINLYSCFTNALNDRKFEIGVKRAIGASAGSIVRQFFYESLLVMVANTFISVALVTDAFIVYKYIYERIPDDFGNYHIWTIYVSPYSIAMFSLCAVTLTVVFSLIFAYKATHVEIVRYLKAE